VPKAAEHNASRWLAPVAFALSFIVFYFSAMPLLDDPDVPWHLATGRLLLHTHQLPTTDPWSFASNGAPWYVLSWLWNSVLGVTEHLSGSFGVFMLSVTLCASLLAAQTIRLTHFTIEREAILLTLILSTLCMVDFVSARPHLLGYIMILAFCHILHISRQSGRYASLWLLPLLMLVWANSHGSFLTGYTLLGAYGIEAIAHKNKDWLLRLLVISALCIITGLITPYSTSVITGAMQSIDSDLRAHIIEWQPFQFGKGLGLSAWVVMFILLTNLRNNEIPLADKIMSMAWLIATFMIMRNGAIFMLVSAPYLASCMDMQTRNLRNKTAYTPVVIWLKGKSLMQLWAGAAALCMAFTAAMWVMPHQDKIQSNAASIDDVMDYIKTHEPNRRYLSEFDFGGLIIYHAAGDIQFFMDSRSNTAYSSKEMKNYLSYWLLEPGWQQKISAYNIDGIIAHNHSRFAISYADGHYQDEWHLVFAGKRASVYIAAP
jgi:hypothetical protein